MKKLAILLIVVILFALTGCAGIGDWSYKIGNNYEHDAVYIWGV